MDDLDLPELVVDPNEQVTGIPLLPESALAQMTQEEADAYVAILRTQLASRSPLDLACLLRPETERWEHIELLNEYIVALCEYRLTAEGPVPAERVQWWYDPRPARGDTSRHSKRRRYVDSVYDVPRRGIRGYGAFDRETKEPIVFNLAVSMMPRAGKSYIITETTPLWALLQDPDLQIGLATYSDTFAGDWGEQMKQLTLLHHAQCEEEGVAPLLPYPDGGARAARDIFKVQGHLGKIRYTGTGGAVTGKTLNMRIADDLVKNEEDMLSDANRAQIQRFIDSTWKTRNTRRFGKPGQRIFLPIPVEIRMGTRWHRMDPIGYSCYDPETNEPNPEWCILNIPALATKGPDEDPLGREIGEAHDNAAGLVEADLEDLRAKNPRTFSALYQGNPAIEGGGLINTNFRDWWYDKSGEHFCWRASPAEAGEVPELMMVPVAETISFAAADMAATKKTASDFTVLGTFAYSREHDMVFITSWYRDHLTTDQYVETLVPVIEDYGCFPTVVENVTYGQVFGQALERQKLDVEYADAQGDKVARAVSSRVSERIRKGGLRVQRGAPYISLLVSECGLFPNDEHDDQVDVIAFANAFVNKFPDWTPPKVAKQPSIVEQIEEHALAAAKRRSARGSRRRWGAIKR